MRNDIMDQLTTGAREPLIEWTMGELLAQRAREYPDTDCLVHPQNGVRLTYKQFDELTDRVARGLMAIGVKKGDHVCIWATNYPEWLITMWSTAKMGAVLVTVNTAYKVFEVEYLLKQSDAHTLIMIQGFKDSDYVGIIQELCPELQDHRGGELRTKRFAHLRNIIYIGEDTPAGMLNFTDLYAAAERVPPGALAARKAELDRNDVINMQYTSGTTGFPKGVMLTHRNIVNNGRDIGAHMRLTHQDRLCIPVPLFHCFGCVLAVMACVTHGSTMVLVDRFNPIVVMQTIQAERCTAVHGVPTMFITMLEHPRFTEFDLSTLRTGIMAGSPCPVEYMKRAMSQMNMRQITISYGQTEASPVVTMTSPDDPVEKRVSTIGRVMANMQVKIIDPETGQDLPFNTQGEIVCKGYMVMRGYYNMPEATHQAIDADGWLHTGDLGTMDEEGYFHITGRLKDMIIRGGENIYPREIEEFLYTHAAVRDVQVVGVPDKVYGEEVMAFIVRKDGAAATEEEIIEYARMRLARHKAPRYVQFVEDFPMTASGKIQKYRLREMAIELLKRQADAAVVTA